MLQCLTIDPGLILAQSGGVLSNIWSVLLLVFGFSLVVFVHELGHFLAAKWAGVRVEKFAIGFGKELFGFTKGETRYCFNLLPLGGYVKMLGQEDFVVNKSGELKVKEDPNAFTNKSVGKRMVIVTSGVIMNLIFAAIAFTIVTMVGLQKPPAVIGNVLPNSPAGLAGLRTGDEVLEINGDPIEDFIQFSQRIALSDQDEDLEMVVRRDGKILKPNLIIRPRYIPEQQIRQVGVGQAENLRVNSTAIYNIDEARPNQLNAHDVLYRVVIDGKEVECKDQATVFREMIARRGEPIEVQVKRPKDTDALTDDQILSSDSSAYEHSIESVKLRAFWTALPYGESNGTTASLLGLVPRMSILYSPIPGKSFANSGAKPGDIIARLGTHHYPSFAELKKTIEEGEGKEIPLQVSRPHGANEAFNLDVDCVEFFVQHREALIRAALEDPQRAAGLAAKLVGESGLQEADQQSALAFLKDKETARDWRIALENVDLHQLKDLNPSAPFALFSSPPASIDAFLACIDEAHVVVADVIEQFGDRETAAHKAGIKRGAVVLSVDSKPINAWYQLAEALMAAAGKTVTVEYRLVDKIHTARMDVPNCVQAALGMGPQDRILKIAGESSARVTLPDQKTPTLELPNWRVTEALLAKHVGKTVNVEYLSNGQELKGEYAVTADNTDPWFSRIKYSPRTFLCWPLMVRNPIHNPFKAFVAGIRKAHWATVTTVQSIIHIVFTRQVGAKKVSGPVGIIRMGAKVADSGLLNLLWFLGLISANLAVINFLPLPIVDGGLFLFLVLEKIRGEPVSIKTQVATQLIGIALIATLFILVTYQDILNWITGGA